MKMALIKIEHADLQGEVIKALGPYRPWSYHKSRGGTSSDYPRHSGLILDLKEMKQSSISYFCDVIVPLIRDQVGAMAVVPSHDPEKKTSGVHKLVSEIAKKKKGTVDAGRALIRTKKVDKLASGGDRSIDIHLESINVSKPGLIKDRFVLLFDDVTTSGNSLIACHDLLLGAGAKGVQCVALGKTTY